jgi:hypothetical protein
MSLGYVKQHAVGFMHTKIQVPTSHTSREQLIIQVCKHYVVHKFQPNDNYALFTPTLRYQEQYKLLVHPPGFARVRPPPPPVREAASYINLQHPSNQTG